MILKKKNHWVVKLKMNKDEMYKLSILVVPSSWVIGAIIALIIYFSCSQPDKLIWTKSYVLGLVTCLLTFGLSISGGRGFIKEVNKPDGAPVRRSILGYILRLLVAGSVFAYIVYNQNSSNPKFNVIPALIGYITVKVVLIISSLILKSRKKVES